MATLPLKSLRDYLDSGDVAPTPLESEFGPLENWSDDFVIMAAGQGRPEALAERDRRTSALLGKGQQKTEVHGSDSAIRRWLEEKTKAVGDRIDTYERTPSPSAGALRPLVGLPPTRQTPSTSMSVPVAPVPAPVVPVPAPTPAAPASAPPEAAPAPVVAAPVSVSRQGVATVPSQGRQPVSAPIGLVPSYTLEEANTPIVPSRNGVPSYTLEDPNAPIVPGRNGVPSYTLEEASPAAPAGVPVVQAPPPSAPDVPAAPVAKMAESRPQASVAPPPPPPSAPEAGAAGDDVLGRLGFGQALVRALEGSGSIIANRDLRSGMAETLGERMKQIEALRAKREEQGLEQAREKATWGASNRGQLNSQIAQFKDNPIVLDALKALESSVETTKPADFQKALFSAITTRPKAEGIQAGTEKAKAGTGQIVERTATDVATRPGKVRKLQTAADLDQARIDKLRRETAANALGMTKSAKAVEEAGKGNTPSKDAIKYIRDDIKTAEKAITPTLENFKNIELASPGFAFGKPDKSIATLDFVTAARLPVFADKARDLRSAVEALIIDIRHGSFGASLTAGEKESFETLLQTGLTGTVEQLSRAIDKVRRKAAATAQTHFNTSMSFYPSETRQVLSTSAVFGPATSKGGVYSDVWALPAGPSSAVAPPAGAVARLKADPALAPAFDQKYGEGAAARVLGGP